MYALFSILFMVLFVVFFVKWVKLRRLVRRIGDYYELMYSYNSKHELLFAVISPVRAVRPRSEYSGFTAKVYFTDYADAVAERDRLIEHHKVISNPTTVNFK